MLKLKRERQPTRTVPRAMSHSAQQSGTWPTTPCPPLCGGGAQAGCSGASVDRPVRGAQAGATLIEVLVALGILASAIVILITGLSTGSFAVRSTDTLTTASNLAAVQLENIKAKGYDPTGASYTPVAVTSGYTVSIATNVITTGLQQITVTVVFNGGSFKVSNYKVDR